MASTGEGLAAWRKGRDAWVSLWFRTIYGNPFDGIAPALRNTQATTTDTPTDKE